MGQKYAILKGIAGLGNRLVTLALCLEYCDKTNRKLFIDWRDGLYLPKGENAFYPYFSVDSDNIIFDPDEFSKEAVDDDKYNLISDYNIYDHWTFSDAPDIIKKTKLYRLLEYLPKSISPVRGFKYIGDGKKDFIYSYQSYFFGRKNEDIIPLCEYLPLDIERPLLPLISFYYNYNKDYLRKIKPADRFYRLCDEFLDSTVKGDDFIALHIRATDNPSKKDIPAFINKLKKFALEKDIKYVFLATDSREVEDLLKKEFENLIIYPKFLPEVNEFGGGIHHYGDRSGNNDIKEQILISSIIDIILLSKGKYLFYQKNSSFSEISRVWKNKEEDCFNWLEF